MNLTTTRIDLALPAWLEDELADTDSTIPDRTERMRLVHRLADRNWREGNGGPFAALVAEATTGRIVSVGVNVVLEAGISAGHAEVMALATAQRAVGSWDLGADGLAGHELVVNWRPCVQCYGAALWSGITTLAIAGSGPELEDITGFDEGPMHPEWAEQFQRRGIDVIDGLLRADALEVFRAYRTAHDANAVVVYNARSAATQTA